MINKISRFKDLKDSKKWVFLMNLIQIESSRNLVFG